MGPVLHGAAEVYNDWNRCRTSPCARGASGPRCVVELMWIGSRDDHQ